MIGELSRIGLWGRPNVSFSDATRTAGAAPWRSIGEHGCYLSHLRVLSEAAEAEESVLLLEDDCDFTRAATSQQPDVDVLWGGYTLREKHIEGAHCVGFSARAAQRLVPYLTDWLDHPSPPPVDGAYILFLRDNPDLSVHACSPMLAVQRPSDSDIAGAFASGGNPALLPAIRVARAGKRFLKRRLNIQGQGQAAFEALVERLRDA
ncbi:MULTISPECIES: hypothetical protein [Sphingomonas]|uniref:hypothetical protein n=1 Tax=Sphingomonas TaxID=13687 RepID=UPI001269CF8C|nr:MULTISPECIES: hypothetical protein [Sphingomonas]